MYSHHLYRWEAALLMAFAVVLTIGMWASVTQRALADEVLRLHVVANSDSDADQAVKLQVRDAILTAATPYLDGVNGQEQAEQALEPHLSELAQAGAAVLGEAGMDYPITVTITDQWFPTKEYTDFALPAGTYRSLQVVLGQGQGHNWWCVVFPPLCVSSVSEESVATSASGVLSEDQISLISGQDGEYVLRFKVLEWWDSLVQYVQG
ncbi:stage II sporulation protein R [Pseudoflavonifractor capillosus]|uniref:stage II sporulation protein R n=1 Tax=Pseudoflavonifractor capillosus TaxID=106588 RepID=UPI001956C7EC|nr:stage II sporulation protein R [Pseudoflavonifractor capillosus]MBM6896790.1 stage II sporulation protein R [Pseudoflavonifractor capillosus]